MSRSSQGIFKARRIWQQGLFRMLGLLAHFIACISPAKTVFAVGSDL